MNSRPPISEDVPKEGKWPSSWSIWLLQVFDCLPWKKAFNYTFTYDFGACAANATTASTAQTITGVRAGDAVQVTPATQTNGIIYTGMVTASDAVTIYANNITTGAINPASTVFRIIVLQN